MWRIFIFFYQLDTSETPDFLAFFLNSEHFYSMRGDLWYNDIYIFVDIENKIYE